MRVAVLIPCYNEEPSIGKVVRDFKRVLPQALVYVYDNNSTDRTAQVAAENGAIVRRESRQGKGNVLRTMFREVDADLYLLADGDDTYPAEAAPALLEAVRTGQADMAVGDRLSGGSYKAENKRPFHSFGNRLVAGTIRLLFRQHVCDILSGYRAFNRVFVKTCPIMCEGFEVETAITLFALDRRFLIKEIPVAYRDRGEGSVSKLRTFRDGFKVIKTILGLCKNYKPFLFFGVISLILFLAGLATGIPTVLEFIRDRFVSKVPSAILAVGLELLAAISLLCGIVLDALAAQHKENFERQLNAEASSEHTDYI